MAAAWGRLENRAVRSLVQACVRAWSTGTGVRVTRDLLAHLGPRGTVPARPGLETSETIRLIGLEQYEVVLLASFASFALASHAKRGAPKRHCSGPARERLGAKHDRIKRSIPLHTELRSSSVLGALLGLRSAAGT
jgi:hypothetical protein